MRTIVQMLIVALLSAWTAVFLYRRSEPSTGSFSNWNSGRNGEAQYARLVETLLSARSNVSLLSAAPTNFTQAAEIATPAVVNVRALLETDRGLWGRTLANSSGSGVILSPDGYIATNHHVVAGSRDIKVTLFDKRMLKARLIGSDPSTDIALLKIDALDLPFLLFGNSDSVRVGEWVLAVGNPFNLESTVTAGIVSAKGRNINILGGATSIESFIQTDAAVNPGNSGGALVNTFGELIGINTAIVTESGSYEGYSFAVPSNLVQKVVRDLREFGEVHRAFLGVNIEDLDGETARDLGLANADGVHITRVHAHGAAADGGLQAGDVILSIDNIPMRRTPELQEYIGRLRPGERVSLEYWRHGIRRRATVVLKDRNNSTASIPRATGLEFSQDLGFELRELTPEEKQRMRIRGAVVVSVRKGSIIHETNMVPGYIITSVNGNRVSNLAETVDCIRNAHSILILEGYYEGEPDLYSYRFRKPTGE